MRKILYISGSRADYGPARRVLQAIQKDSAFSLSLLVAGMHLDPVHGETWKEIEADGFTIASKVKGAVVDDSLSTMAGSIGLYLQGMSQSIATIDPDIVLVLGDRGEQLAGAMAGAFQNKVVVHLCGGGVSGSIDDSIRHAITKFSHYHLPGYEEHARRIIQMGEDPSTVHIAGLPGGDLRPDVTFSRTQILTDYQLPKDEPYLLLVQHSVTQTQAESGDQIEETLEALLASGYTTLLANPNDDAGGRVILSKMKDYAARSKKMRLFEPPKSRERFASVMAYAGALVGNSSSAVAEAMSVALPVVNIGDRQQGREHLAHWINVPHKRDAISKGIQKALFDTEYRKQLQLFSQRLNQVNTSEVTIHVLKSLDLKKARRAKGFFDFPKGSEALHGN